LGFEFFEGFVTVREKELGFEIVENLLRLSSLSGRRFRIVDFVVGVFEGENFGVLEREVREKESAAILFSCLFGC